MDAGSIKSRLSVSNALGKTTQQRPDTQIRSTSPAAAKDALLSVQAELGVALRTAKVLAKETPPISEDEATETAERIADLLKASGNAFGSDAVLFQELSPDRAKALLL